MEKRAGQEALLIVDPDSNYRREFERLFADKDLKVLQASGGAEALDLIKDQEIELVMADYRMPGMDGCKLLHEIRALKPRAYRILSSGFLDISTISRFLSSGLATCFIAKPWDTGFLSGKILHLLEVRAVLNHHRVLEQVQALSGLPTLPRLYQELVMAIENNLSMDEITAIIKKDAAVSSKVLKVVNSAFIGRSGISSIREAVLYLGVELLKDIVLTAELIDMTRWSPEQVRELRAIFAHSFLVNKYLPFFYRALTNRPFSPHFPSLGIVHDIGKLFLIAFLPQRYEEISALKARDGLKDFFDSELALGYADSSHAVLGGFLLDIWNFPEPMIEAALFHHSPERSHAEYGDLIRATRLTDHLVNAAVTHPKGIPFESADPMVRCLAPEVYAKLCQGLLRDVAEQDRSLRGLI